MSVRSYLIQLQAGVGQALLPDHRKMIPGVQYVVDAETFSKISLGARQNVIKVVKVITDFPSTAGTTASGTFVPAQSSTGLNQFVSGGNSFLNILTQVSTSLSGFQGSLAGFAAQGASAGGAFGTGAGVGLPQASLSGSANNFTLIGADGSRYALVYNNAGITISGGWASVWADYNNRYITVASGATLQVNVDGQGVPYVVSSNATAPGYAGNVTTVGTKAGEFAGVALTNIPTGNFGFVQIEGVCPTVVVASGTAVGAPVAVKASDPSGTLATPSNTTVSVSSAGVVTGSALANNMVGTLLTSPASGTGTGQWFAAVEIRSRRVKKPYVRVLNKN